jgi:2-iminobutanoate/2-iminopropanoate deaminase
MHKLAGFLILVSMTALAADKKAVTAPNLPPSKNFSHGIKSGGMFFVAGQVGRTKDGKIPENFEEEVKATLENVGSILKAGGASFADVVAVNVYLTDMALFDKMNGVYVTFFPEPRPVRTTVGVSKLVGTSRIEITVTAKADK